MKKLSTSLMLLCIIITIILSSCSNSNSIMKRRYTKGYYVSHGKNKHSQAVKHEKTGVAKIQQPVLVSPKVNEEVVISQPSPVASQPAITAQNNKVASQKTSTGPLKKSFNNLGINKSVPAELLVKQSFKAIKAPIVQKSVHDGLSLFWIVIVVLLVLFFLGLAGDVLGALIYILLVVALVCLILWLLRIL